MVNTAGEPSDANRGEFVTSPLLQLRLTLTLAGLSSLKSLNTVKELELEILLFTSVQLLLTLRAT